MGEGRGRAVGNGAKTQLIWAFLEGVPFPGNCSAYQLETKKVQRSVDFIIISIDLITLPNSVFSNCNLISQNKDKLVS